MCVCVYASTSSDLRCTYRFRQQQARWLLLPAAPAPPQSSRFSRPREEAYKEEARVQMKSGAEPPHRQTQRTFCKLTLHRHERECGASDTYVCKAALVAFMRFLSVIFSNINKALVSCPCRRRKRRRFNQLTIKSCFPSPETATT